jgi:solute carrier family 4 (sodium borate transporter), member 11
MDSNDDVATHAMDTAPRDVERASMGEALDDSATRDIQDVRAGASVRRAYTARTNTLLTQASSDGDDRVQSMCVWRTCRVLPLKPVRVELQARRDLIKMCAGRAPASAMIDAFSTPSTSVHFEIMLDVRIRDAGDPFKCACPSLIAREMLERVAAQPGFGAIPAETMSRELVIDQTNTTDDVLDDSEAHAFKQAFYTKSAVVVPYTSRVLENQRIVILARLATPMSFDDGNSGGDDGAIRFVCLVLSGDAIPPAKNAYATSHTMVTLLSDESFIADAMRAENEDDICSSVGSFLERAMRAFDEIMVEEEMPYSKRVCSGIVSDIRRRLPWYISDWTDGFASRRVAVNVLSTTVWLFSSTLIPCLALGMSLQQSSARQMTHVDFLLSEALCNIVFATVGGQALLVLRTSGPTVTFIKVMRSWSTALNVNFLVFLSITGLYAGLIIIAFAILNGAELMLCINRFTSEQLALFVSLTFVYTGFSAVGSMKAQMADDAMFLKYLMLHIGTVALAFKILTFRTSHSIRRGVRVIVSDVAPILSIASLTLLSFAVPNVSVERVRDYVPNIALLPQIVNFASLQPSYWVLALLPASVFAAQICLETSIAAMLTCRSENKLFKGSAYNWDMLVVGILTVVTSLFGLPPSVPALPHSHMHARSLAMTSDSYRHGVVRTRVYGTVETRVTNFAAHICTLIVCFFRTETIGDIPIASLSGFLVFMGLSSLFTNGLVKRLLGSTVAPVRFLRRVPKRVLHAYTGIQTLMFSLMFTCRLLASKAPGFAIFYPAVLIATIPVSHYCLPMLFGDYYASVMSTASNDENLVGLFY